MSLQERLNGSESLEDPLALQGRIGSSEHDRPLDRFAELRAALHNACIAKVGPELIGTESDPEALRARVREVVTEELGRHVRAPDRGRARPSSSRTWSTTCSATARSTASSATSR